MSIAGTDLTLGRLTATAHAAVTRAAAGHRLDPTEQVATIGGTALGFVLASAFAEVTPGVTMPPWTLASPDEVTSDQFERAVHAVCAPGASGILVKYSSVNESFTPHARRGANSSARAQFRTVGEGTAGLVVGAARNVTAATRAVLLQDLVPLSGERAGYVHVYIYDDVAVVEYITPSEARLLFAGDAHGELYVESVNRADVPTGDRFTLVSHARAFARFATEALTGDRVHNWNIEGAWDPDARTLYIFQSRPSPADRPGDGHLPPLDRPANTVWTTHFVWGQFDITTTLDKVTLRTERDIRTAGPAAPLLPTALVVATDAAFRLSHEPYFLPPVVARDGYNFVHIPRDVVERIGHRQARFYSNGDECYVALV